MAEGINDFLNRLFLASESDLLHQPSSLPSVIPFPPPVLLLHGVPHTSVIPAYTGWHTLVSIAGNVLHSGLYWCSPCLCRSVFTDEACLFAPSFV